MMRAQSHLPNLRTSEELEPPGSSRGNMAVVLRCSTFVWFAVVAAPEAHAQLLPGKPIRIVVGYSAGGGVDSTARLIAQKGADVLGQPIIVENRAGASGAIATERVAKSPADGHTLLMATSTETSLPFIRVGLPYDFQRDLTPIAMAVLVNYVLTVHPSVPAHNVKELIALARSSPGKLIFGSGGIGGAAHLAGELFNTMANVKTLHVAYKGGAENTIATAGGQNDMSYGALPTALPLLQGKKLRAIAVTRTKRLSLLPSVATLSESGLPGYDFWSWYGLFAPKGVNPAIVARLNALTIQALNAPDLKTSFDGQGFEPQNSTPEDVSEMIRREMKQHAQLIATTGIKAQ